MTAEADSSASGNAILEFASEHCPDTPLAVGPSSVPGASAQPAGDMTAEDDDKSPPHKATLHELNTHLSQALSDAEESNRLKSEFLTNMSHELQIPLNGFLDCFVIRPSTMCRPSTSA